MDGRGSRDLRKINSDENAAQAPLWPSLAHIAGGRSIYDKDSKPEERCWTTFFASECRMAREMKEEIARIRHLRGEALDHLDAMKQEFRTGDTTMDLLFAAAEAPPARRA